MHLEFLPWSAFPNVNAAWEVVRVADRPNGGLIIDSWHCARSATTLDDIAAIPGERVFAVQLSDALPERVARRHRRDHARAAAAR